MRRMIPQSYQDWIKKLKDYIGQDGNTTEIGESLNVRGALTASGNVSFNGFSVYISNTLSAKNLDVRDILGQPISQGDFYENKLASVDISYFSAFKIGQFIYLDIECSTGNYTAGQSLFYIKSAYRPKINQKSDLSSSNWGNISYIEANGKALNVASSTSENSTFTAHFFYEIA